MDGSAPGEAVHRPFSSGYAPTQLRHAAIEINLRAKFPCTRLAAQRCATDVCLDRGSETCPGASGSSATTSGGMQRLKQPRELSTTVKSESCWITSTGRTRDSGARRAACARRGRDRVPANRSQLTLLDSPTVRRAPVGRRMTAAYISFSTGRSPKACGMIFVRRRSSRKRRSSKFVVRITRRWRSGKRRWAMHASKSSRKHCTTAGSSRS